MLQRAITVPLPGPHQNARQYLEKYGFKPPKSRYMQIGLAVALGIAAVGGLLALSLKLQPTNGDLDIPSMILVGITVATLVLGSFQWRDARSEVSLDKYYDRLDLANKRQDGTHTRVHQMMQPSLPELAGEHHEVLMYVYAELDNLEYVIEKYSLGYMTDEHACRGLKTFQLRCWSEQFRRIARHRVHAGDYRKGTALVVDRVYEEVEKLVQAQYQPAAEPTAERRRTARRATDFRLLSGNQSKKEAATSDPVQPKGNGHAPGSPSRRTKPCRAEGPLGVEVSCGGFREGPGAGPRRAPPAG